MSIQEEIPVKNTEERLASLAVVAASELTLHLCRVVRWSGWGRIRAEERILSQDAGWSTYVTLVRHRLFPGLG